MNGKTWVRVVSPYAPATVAVLAALLFAAAPAGAALNTYSSRPAFLAAAGGGLALAHFEGLGGNTYQTLHSGIEASIPPGVIFSSTGGSPNDLFVAPPNFNGNPAITTDSLFANFFGTPLIADFSPDITAVGADVIAFSFAGTTATITVSAREPNNVTSTYFVTPPQGSSEFFGLIATGGTLIERISYDPPDNFTAGIDDFVFGNAIPEPASGVALALGSLAMFGAARRQRARQSPAR